MTLTALDADISNAVSLLKVARHSVALTGAGISTPSGIPDFRSPGSGLWERFDPMEVASLASFRHHPEQFYAWIHPLAQLVFDARPNPAHYALARLEANGHLAGIVTQNIDDLHQRAGSQLVLELHGHLREATCTTCYAQYATRGFIESFLTSGQVPRCPGCAGILKPNAVLFGEELPYDVVHKARNLIDGSDLILVAGSSLEVIPAASLPIPALNSGARLIIINQLPTYLDVRADVLIQEDLALVLPRIVEKLYDDFG